MQATKYKLYYFDISGRGELPRILFAAAGQPFEDVRIRSEDWPTYKPKMPFGQMPVLEVDGTMISQEYAISKFLAKEFGFCSESNFDQAREDMYVFTAEDIFLRMVDIYYKQTEKLNADELIQKFVEEVGPNILSKLDEHLEASKSGFFVGDRMTYADLTMYHTLTGMAELLPKESVSLLAPYANLKRHMDLVSSHPNMVIYLQKRAEAEKQKIRNNQQ